MSSINTEARSKFLRATEAYGAAFADFMNEQWDEAARVLAAYDRGERFGHIFTGTEECNEAFDRGAVLRLLELTHATERRAS